MIFRMLLIFLLCFWITTPALSRVVERIVAIVDSGVITQTDLDKYREKLKKNEFIDEMLVTDPSALLEDRKKLIDHLINERLMDAHVKELALSVSGERIQQEIQRIAQNNNINRQQLLDVLKRQGVSFEDYRGFIRTKLERQALVERLITPYIQISDDDIAYTYYSQQKGTKTPVYEYKIAHLLSRWDPSKGEDGVKEAKSKAEGLHDQLESGQTLEALAAQQGKSSGLISGGSLGTFNSNELLDDFQVAIANLDPGEFSEVVKGQGGFYILQLTAKTLIEDPDFTRKKPEIQRQLFQNAFQKRLQIWLNERRHQAFVKINAYDKEKAI